LTNTEKTNTFLLNGSSSCVVHQARTAFMRYFL